MQGVTFVTSNEEKVKEVEHILGMSLNRESIDVQEIQDMDLSVIIEHKVRQSYQILKKPVIAEDAGLYLDAWGGFPGPFIKWLHKTMGYEVLPKALTADNRKATWKVAYAYFDGTSYHCFMGESSGTIATERRGENGWGFDPIFIPDGESLTFAEMGDKKYDYSARGRAILKLKAFLDKKADRQVNP